MQCTFCDAGTAGDERQMVFECAKLASLRAKYADWLNDNDQVTPSFLAQ